MSATLVVKDKASPAALAVAAAATQAKQPIQVHVDGTLKNDVELSVGGSLLFNAVGAITYFTAFAASSSAQQADWLHRTFRVLVPNAAIASSKKPTADNAVVAILAGSDEASEVTSVKAVIDDIAAALAANGAGKGVAGEFSAVDVAIAAAIKQVSKTVSVPAAVSEYSAAVDALEWVRAASTQLQAATVSGGKRKADAATTTTAAATGAGTATKATAAAGATAKAEGGAKPAKEGGKPKKDIGKGIDVLTITSKAPIDTTNTAHFRKPLIDILREAFTAAIVKAFPSAAGVTADVSIAERKFNHHYQCNSALQLVSKLKGTEGAPANPRVAAEKLMAAANEIASVEPAIGAMEIAGPGYINIYVSPQYLAARSVFTLTTGVQPPTIARERSVVVDYSSPNIAKEMHIGHLRSTIIGDTIARILEFLGHKVKRVNHVGDWGTQFGMLIAHLKDLQAAGQNVDVSISDLTKFYKDAKKRFDAEPEFKDRAHKEVVALQAGDAVNRELWQRMVSVSQNMFNEVYKRLEVDSRLELCGESFYNDKIPTVIAELESKGITTLSESAVVIRVPGHEVPLMVRKSDGGFGYDSTDLAAIKYRLHDLKADWLVYVVDAGQSLHFDLLFGGAQMAGWYSPTTTRVEHVGFGIIQGEDGKRLKTRSGDTVRLVDVLDEAVRLAKEELLARMEKGAGAVDMAHVDETAAALGYGGVKYFDLRQNRLTDYVFSYDRMLSPDGDTAVYLEYAHARLRSILRKATETGVDVEAVLKNTHTEGIKITHATEVALLCEIAKFGEALTAIEADLLPHHLAGFLFELGTKIGDFHRDCYVLGNATPPDVRDSRLRMVKLVADVMAKAMVLIGIKPLDRI